jgi:hypothetical protein
MESALTIVLENLPGHPRLLDGGQRRLYQHERLRNPRSQAQRRSIQMTKTMITMRTMVPRPIYMSSLSLSHARQSGAT